MNIVGDSSISRNEASGVICADLGSEIRISGLTLTLNLIALNLGLRFEFQETG